MTIEVHRVCYVLILLLNLAFGQRSPPEGTKSVNLKGKTATQSNTHQDDEANNAIDGDASTWSDTSSDGSESIGWWKVDLKKAYNVVGVSVTSPDDPYDAYNLQQFQIKVVTKSDKENLCTTYTDEPFEPGASKYLQCVKALKGRQVLLKKLPGSYRKDAITIAEIEIHVLKKDKVSKSGTSKNNVTDLPKDEFEASISTSVPPTTSTGVISSANDDTSNKDSTTTISPTSLTTNSSTLPTANITTISPTMSSLTAITNTSSTTISSATTTSTDISSSNITTSSPTMSSMTTMTNSSSTPMTSATTTSSDISSTSISYNAVTPSKKPCTCNDTIKDTSVATVATIGPTTVITATTSASQTTEPIEHPAVPPPEISRNVTQIGTYGYHIADFAIDGNDQTCAIACHPCDQSTKYGYGWWQYDLGSVRTIGEVRILTCPHQHNANYLRDIIIGITIENTTDWKQLTKCSDYGQTNSNVPTSRWLNFKCSKPIDGRYLLVIRKMDASYRPDVVALAGIEIEDQDGSLFNTTGIKKGTPVDQKVIESQLNKKKWYQIDLKNLKTEQVGVFDTFESKYAVDGDVSTCAVACENCHERTGLGWWKVSLGKVHKIVAVQIVSSPKDYDSNYLQEFIIENGEKEICVEYINRTFIPSSTTISLSCDRLLEGDQLIVKRRHDSSFRADAIAIAEIFIFAEF